MAGLTVTLEKEWREGKRAHAVVKITFDAAYLVGGESLDLSAYMKDIHFIDGYVTEDAPGYVLDFDDTNFATAIALVEVNIAEYTAGADGVLIEAGAINLSTVSARIHAFGDAF